MVKKTTLQNSLIAGIALGVSACGGGGSSSNTNIEDPILEKEQAIEIISQYVSNPEYNVEVGVGFSPIEEINCDILGDYSLSGDLKKVCFVYNLNGPQGVPNFSPSGVDLVSRIQLGTQNQIHQKINESLQNTSWAPIFYSESLDFGSHKLGTEFFGEFDIKGSGQVYGECNILDEQGNLISSTGNLEEIEKVNGVTTLGFSNQNGFSSLGEGNYTFNCSFSDINGTKEIENIAKINLFYLNSEPVISGIVSPLEVIIGENSILGGTCIDEESGVLNLSPTNYTSSLPETKEITRTCTDGENSVQTTQTINSVCPTGTSWNGSSCQIPYSPPPSEPTPDEDGFNDEGNI